MLPGVKNPTPALGRDPIENKRFQTWPHKCNSPPLETDNNMKLEAFSALGATVSLECAILLLGAALFLDYRKTVRRQWLLGHLQRILQSDPEPVVAEQAKAA